MKSPPGHHEHLLRLAKRTFMSTHPRQVQHATPDVSPSFLSQLKNFITTARSVRWVLQSEEKEKYDAWMSSSGAAANPAEEEIFWSRDQDA